MKSRKSADPTGSLADCSIWVTVADLGGVMGRWQPLPPPLRKFFRFSLTNANEKQVHTTSNVSQNVFFAYDRTRLPKSDIR
jgi:hypothetical protein